MTTRIIAVDWSGAKNARIGIAETMGSELVASKTESERKLVIKDIIKSVQTGESLVVGLDFAFSFPAWFLQEHRLANASELWARVEQEGEKWLTSCKPPFWGLKGSRRPNDRELFRRTEQELSSRAHPKSVFQIYGAGAVGRSSIRGMPYLLRLKQEGFSIWPFDPPRFPLVVEIYPRLLTGPVVKSDRVKRAEYLRRNYPKLSQAHYQLATRNEDVFDATVSALEMTRHAAAFYDLVRATEQQILLEGMIWHPHQSKNAPN